MQLGKNDDDELTLWVISSVFRSGETEQAEEKSFIYALDDIEVKEIVERWKELHPGYQVQRLENYPEGYRKDGELISGKKLRNQTS